MPHRVGTVEPLEDRRLLAVVGGEFQEQLVGAGVEFETPSITLAQVEQLADAAAARWQAAGIDAAQLDALNSADYRVADLAPGRLGAAEGFTITIDVDAAGQGWFVDATPLEDSEFGAPSAVGNWQSIDLLSVLIHEQGHLLGLDDVYFGSERANVMFGLFGAGQRRLPEFGQADGAVAGSLQGVHFATAAVVDVYGHNEKTNYAGTIDDMIIGSGMNGHTYVSGDPADPGFPWPTSDPSTWYASSNQYQNEWQSQDLLGDGEAGEDIPTNGKIGWAAFDLGAAIPNLDQLYLWNVRENTGRPVKQYNIYYAETPTVGLVHGPTGNISIDYNFSSGGWTLLNSGGALTMNNRTNNPNGAAAPNAVLALGGVTARYIAIEILTNGGDTTRTGLAEVGITYTPPATTNVGLDGSDNLLIEDTAAGGKDDTLTLSINGANVRVTDPNNQLAAGSGAAQIDPYTVEVPLADITGGNVNVMTLGGDDTLTVNLPANGFGKTIDYDGGTQNTSPNGDTLVLQGGSGSADVMFTYTDNTSGSVSVADIGGSSTITYTGLEPITSTIDAFSVTLVYSGVSETITVSDPGGSQTTVNSSVGEMTTFNNPTGMLTIHSGAGNDTINVNGLAGNYPASVNINAQGDTDSLTYAAPVSLAAGKNLVSSAETININTATITSGGTQQYDGSVVVQADTILTGTGVSFDSLVNGDGSARNLTVNASGTTTFSAPVGSLSALGALTTDAAGTTSIGASTINTSGGTIIFNDPVTLTADTVLTDTGATGIFFMDTVDSDATPRDLTVITTNAASEIEFRGAVGNGNMLDQVTVTNAGLLDILAAADFDLDGAFNQNGAGAVDLAGDVTTTDDAITFATAITLRADVALDTGANGGNITLNGTVDDDGATSNRSLTLTAGTGTVDVNQAVGGNTPLDSFSATAATTDIGGSISTANNQVYDGNVTFTGNRTLTAANINFRNGTTTFDGTNTTISVTGTATSEATNLLDFQDGDLILGSSSFVSDGTAQFRFSGNFEVRGTGGTFTNNGTFNLLHVPGGSNDNFELFDSITFQNTSTGVVDFQGQSDFRLRGTTTFNNAGLVTKSVAGADESFIFGFTVDGDNGTFHNLAGGEVRGAAGTINIAPGAGGPANGNTSDPGATWTANGGNVQLSGFNTWTGTYNGSASGSNYVTIELNANGSVADDFNVGAGGATFNITGNGLQWSDSNIDTNGNNVTNLGVMTIVSGAAKQLRDAGELITGNGGVTTVNDTVTSTGGAAMRLLNGGLLYGTGNFTGDVTAESGGTVSPGLSPGILSVGNTTLNAGASLGIEMDGNTAGTGYDQLNVTGTVDVTGAFLNVSGSHAAVGGESFTIINNDLTDAVTGTFAGLPEGAQMWFNFSALEITYAGGTDNNDVVLSFDSTPVINADELSMDVDNDIIVRETAPASGVIEVLVDGSLMLTAALADLTDLTINGQTGDDTLTIDYATGGAFFALPITFNGGTQTTTPNGDTLVLTGGTVTDQTFNYDNLNDGNIDLDGTVITYTGLEPISSTINATNVALNYSATSETITVTDPGGSQTTVTSTAGETTTFNNPSTSLVINSGAGTDTININSLEAGFAASVEAGTFGDTDVVNFNSSLTLGSDLKSTADTININGGSITTAGEQEYVTVPNTGIILGNDTTLTGTLVQFIGNVDSDVVTPRNLTVDTTAGLVTNFAFPVGNTRPLNNLTTNADGTTWIQDNVTTVGNQTYNDPVELLDHATLTGNDVTFADTVDGDGFGPWDLVVDSSGNIAFHDAVGAGTALQSLTINNAVGVTFGSTVTTTADVEQSAGTGTTAFNGAGASSIGGGLRITTDAISVNAGTVTSNLQMVLTAVDQLTSGQNIVVTGTATLESVLSDVILITGDDVQIDTGASLVANGGVQIFPDSIDADPAGATVNVFGSITTGLPALIEGGPQADIINLDPASTTGTINIDGRAGDDDYFVQLSAVGGPVQIMDRPGEGIDDLVVPLTNAPDVVTIDAAQTASGGNTVSYTADLENLQVQTGDSPDDITVTPSMTLAINILGGDPATSPGDVLTYNLPAGETVSLTPSGPDGGTFTTTNHQDITFDEIEQLVLGDSFALNGTPDDDLFQVTASGADSGTIDITSGGVPGLSIAFSGADTLTFNGGDGNDELIIDQSAAMLALPGGISYNGQGAVGDSDSLTLTGGTAATVTYTYKNDGGADDNQGTIDWGGTVLTYTGLEPITSTINTADVILNYTAGAETITVSDPGGGQTRAASTEGETTTFDNPTNSLEINAGDVSGSGPDMIDVNGIGAGFDADLTINGGSAGQVNFGNDINLINGTLAVTADQINVNAQVTTTGNATLTATSAITDGNGATPNIVANTLTATGSAVDLDTTVTDLTAQASAGDVNIEETDGLIAIDLIATGTVALTAGGAVTDSDGNLDVQTPTAAIVVTGDFGDSTDAIQTSVDDLSVDSLSNGWQWIDEFDGLTALNLSAGLGNVFLTAGGAIEDGDGTTDIVASGAALQAVGGIGSVLALNTAVSYLEAENTTSGNIQVDNVVGGVLTIGDVDGLLGVSNDPANIGGTVTVSNDAGITVNEDVAADFDITLTGGETLATVDEDLAINSAQVSSAMGDVLLQAGDNFDLNPGSLVEAPAGTVTLESLDTNVDPDGSTFTFVGDIDAVDAQFLGAGEDDTFNVRPDQDANPFEQTPITIQGYAPTAAPGDTLQVDLTNLGTPTLSITGANDGRWTFDDITAPNTAADIDYFSIETVQTVPPGSMYNLRLNMFDAGFEDGSLDTIGVNVLAGATKQLELSVNGSVVFTGDLTSGGMPSIASLQIIGSLDQDVLDFSEPTSDLVGPVDVQLFGLGLDDGLFGFVDIPTGVAVAPFMGLPSDFDNIDGVIGSADGEDSLSGPDLPNHWDVGGDVTALIGAAGPLSDTGVLVTNVADMTVLGNAAVVGRPTPADPVAPVLGEEDFAFTGIENLFGAPFEDDWFDFRDGATLTGDINGGSPIGDDGNDSLDLRDYTTSIVVDLPFGAVTDDAAVANDIVRSLIGTAGSDNSIENVFAGDGNDLVTGDDDNNILGDGFGSDVLYGGTGDDRFRLEPGSDDYVFDVSGNDTVDFSFAGLHRSPAAGITFDMDLVGWDADGVVDFGASPTVDIPAPQDVYQDGSDTVTLMRNGALGQTAISPSPIENIVGSQQDDVIDIDPLTTGGDVPENGPPVLRSVDGNSPVAPATPGDTLRFDSMGNEVFDTGDSLTAAGGGTVLYTSIETMDLLNSAPKIIDNGDRGWSFDGAWSDNRSQGYEQDIHFAWNAQPSQVARWTFDGVSDGEYMVSVTWTSGRRYDRADDVLYSVLDDTTVLGAENVDQSQLPNEFEFATPTGTFFDDGVWWKPLPGTFTVDSNTLVVELSGLDTSGFTIADAVRIDRVPANGSFMRVLESDGTLIVDETGAVDFGTMLAGETRSQQFTIDNQGMVDLELGTLNLPVGFMQDPAGPFPATVAGGTTETFSVIFDPLNDPQATSASGDFTGELSFDFGTPGTLPAELDTFNFTISGRAIGTQSDGAVVVDNDNVDAFQPGGFRIVPHDSRSYGRDYRFERPGGTGTATWTFEGLDSGAYQVSTTYFAWPNRSDQAPYTLVGDTTVDVTIDQRIDPAATASAFVDQAGVFWTNLHSGLFVSGGTLTVQLSGTDNGYVIADAIRIQKISDSPLAEIAVYQQDPPGPVVELFDGASTVDFGTTEMAEPVSKTFEVHNFGGTDLEIYPRTLTFPQGFSLQGFTVEGIATDPSVDTALIPAGGMATFTLRLDAAVPGNPSGIVSLDNSDDDENPFNFQVTGAVVPQFIDDGDAGYERTGDFRRVARDSRFYARDYDYLVTGGTGTATWTFDNLVPGNTYQVAVTYFAWHNRATDAPYLITGGYDGPRTVNVNQREAADDFSDRGVFWEDIATVTLDPTGPGTLTVELSGSDTGYVIADAVRLEALYLPDLNLDMQDNGSTVRVQYGETIDFGTALQTTTPETRTFIVTNGGEIPLVLSQPAIDSARYDLSNYYDPGTGNVINDPVSGMPIDPLVLQPRESAAFDVTQLTDTLPGAPGAPFDATISLTSNDIYQRSFQFFVTGVVQDHNYIIDDGDDGFDPGTFRKDPHDPRFFGNDYHFQAPNVDGRAKWTFTGIDPGMYSVSATWFAWGNRATNAAFRAFDGDGTGGPVWTLPVDQTQAPDGAVNPGWQEIGILSVFGDTLTVDVLSGLANGYVIADAVRIDYLGPPLLAAEAGAVSDPAVVTNELIQTSLAAAKQHWLSIDLTRSELARLSQVEVHVGQLPGTVLGYTSAYDATVWIDADAAGHGWMYDSNAPVLQHSNSPFSSGGMDLVSVLAHELGHVVGIDDLYSEDHSHELMSATLEAGERLVVGGPATADLRQELAEFRFLISDFGLASATGEVGQAAFSDQANDDPTEFRIPHSAFRIRDSLFAGLDERAGALTDDYGLFVEDDGKTEEAEDGLDLWGMLF